MTPRVPIARILTMLGLACLSIGAVEAASAPAPTLATFGSEADLQAYATRLKAAIDKKRAADEEEAKKRQLAYKAEWEKRRLAAEAASPPHVAPLIDLRKEDLLSVLTEEQIERLPLGHSAEAIALLAPGSIGAPSSTASSLDTVSVFAAEAPPAAGSNSITNVQTAGVDEGGIVKKSGEFLVVLRRGRLFSIRVNDRTLQAVSSVNAYGPGINGASSWYDEMLISGDTIVVIGYSYEREGTEVGLFHLAKDGRISYRAGYQLFSSDYFSSRNYASRLIGNTLFFYSPIDFVSSSSGEVQFPGYRRLDPTSKAPFRRIVPAERIYRMGFGEDSLDQTLHTITRCEIAADALDCHSSCVLGSWGSAFYVSRNAVYVWILSYGEDRIGGKESDEMQAGVVRFPLDGSPPTALRVQGDPIDQMSFLEKDGYLNVLVGAEGNGLRMWAAEAKRGGLALFRAPLGEFGGAEAWARPDEFRALPAPSGAGWSSMQNRYVGNWLLYGSEEEAGVAHALRVDRKDAPTHLPVRHVVERIEAMGNDALLVGSAEHDLRLSSIDLGASPKVISQFVIPGASQSESRTHGFFYRPLGQREGLFGLPVSGDDKASVQFLRNQDLRLNRAGELDATTKSVGGWSDDGCVASCYDWYGDARPIFIGERVYGLLGYELVEGRLENGRIRETRRLDFRPAPTRARKK